MDKGITRRDLLIGGLGMAGLGAFGKPTSSVVAASGISHIPPGESVPSARAYVQDGIVAMWDGIENAGWGFHNAKALVWKDLVGDLDLTYSGRLDEAIGYWGANCFNAVADGQYRWQGNPSPDIVTAMANNNSITIEGVFSFTQIPSSGNSCLLQINDTSPTDGLAFAMYNQAYLYFSESDAWASGRATCRMGDAWSFLGKKTVARSFYGNGTVNAEVLVDGGGFSASSTSAAITKTPTLLALGSYAVKSLNGRTALGQYNCIRIYNRVLTATEIAANYAIDKVRFGL